MMILDSGLLFWATLYSSVALQTKVQHHSPMRFGRETSNNYSSAPSSSGRMSFFTDAMQQQSSKSLLTHRECSFDFTNASV